MFELEVLIINNRVFWVKDKIVSNRILVKGKLLLKIVIIKNIVIN